MGWTPSEWDYYWKTTGPPQDVVDAQRRWAQRIRRFSMKRGRRLRSMADFGCGPGIVLLELAKLYPATSFHGFEASSALVNRNSKKAAKLGIRNVSFETAVLPAVPSGLNFDLVLCIATLHYIENSSRALRNMFGAVRPGGHLIFNYPNVFTMHWYREDVARSDETERRRFALVLAGKNLLSKRKVEGVLDRRCRNFWKEVGESMDRANPCLFASKPRDVEADQPGMF